MAMIAPVCAFGQAGGYVAQYDVYAGFAYLHTPSLNLTTRGFHIQAAYNTKTWLAMGLDYSNSNGSLSLFPRYLPTSVQNDLAPFLAGLSYEPSVTTDVNTQTFAVGPAVVIRKIRGLGIIIHPSLGAVREEAVPYPHDLLTRVVIASLVPSGRKVDWRGFYGVGGGLDFKVAKHFGIRMHTDLVWDHLFNDILRNGRWTVRASIGPSFHFGRNIRGR